MDEKEMYDMLDEIDQIIYDANKSACEECDGKNCNSQFPYKRAKLVWNNLAKRPSIYYVDCDNKKGSVNDKGAFKDKYKDFSAYNKEEIIKAFKGGNSMFIHGKVGLGKTHICYWASNVYYNKGKSVYIALIQDIVNEYQNMMNNRELNPNAFIKRLQEYDVLIIDDLGNEYGTEFSVTSILQPIIDYRYKKDKVTIISSNYTTNELLEIYADKTRAKKIAPIVSRIETYEIVEIKNKNWRK